MLSQAHVSNSCISVVSYRIFHEDGTFTPYRCVTDDMDFQHYAYAYAIALNDNSVSDRYGDLIASVIIRSSISKNQLGFNRPLNNNLARQQPLLTALKNTPISVNIMDMPSFTN